MATLPAPHTWTASDDATSARMQSLTYGIEFLQATPRAEASLAATATLGTSGLETVIPLTNESLDTDGMHSTTVNTSRFTCVTAGRFLFVAQIGHAASTATGLRGTELWKNGVASARTRFAVNAVQASYVQCIREITLAVGDYVEMYGYQSSGGSADIISGAASTFLHCHWVATS